MTDAPAEADRAPGAPHPRETRALIGQDAAEAAFLDAYTSGRMHHAWLITGPRGVGKATLAWRIARFLLATPKDDGGGLFAAPPPPATLDIDPDHPVAHRTAALSDPGLFLLRRPWDEKAERLRQEITVDEVRRLKHFFELSAADGGRRVVIVDAADEMNTSAANALLKLLEEPPADTTLLLIAHQPSRLLPTILSRCRRLRCRSLDAPEIAEALAQAGADPGPDAAALAALSEGSVGAAIRLIGLDGLQLYADLVATLADPNDRPRALKLADGVAGRQNADRFALLIELFDLFLARAARTGTLGPPDPEAARGEADLLARLSPSSIASRRWAEIAQDLGARARHGRAVNLDPAALILDMVLKVHETAARLAA
ncbi:DNA polymerase III subunit delta' [Psychromarinibacter sp. C21-152]|uniref:DNA polymerase III subunit delta n=1 Tax=Psychromarinibacter sediminicola TaxID=3033385 RepID=A0AAE3T865_9RHOB|nr:DNA polymerase III subunit delta' [Psychromarinibacter sediminicola]MDF0599769.1 DNA polymerase III subunit delta' [Psychromarinibacter sediminicola]